QRCIVLASDGSHRLRLWQIVRMEASLRTQMEQALLGDAGGIANALLSVARSFMQMAERLSAGMCELRLTLGDVATSPGGAIYVGFVPPPPLMRPAPAWSSSRARDVLMSELAFAQPTLRARRSDILAALAKSVRLPSSQSDWQLLQRLAALAR